MIEKTIKYENLAGEQCETICQFHMFENELRGLELDTEGSFSRYLQKIAGEKDSRELCKMFSKLILTSYGELSPDNGKFIKRRNGVKLSEEFEQTAAFDALVTSFFDNPDELVEFIVGIMPAKVQAQVRKAVDENNIKS